VQQFTSGSDSRAGQQFLHALAERDFDGIERLFDDNVQFRALTPSDLCEAGNAADAAGWIRAWIDDATGFELIASSTDPVVDRLHLSYRIRLTYDGQPYVFEQHAYCVLDAGRITTMDLVCSGFRPV
jgi:ketosteroid isomerase-like protein